MCLYADDTQIFASSHDVDELAADLNSDLENISDWLTVNKLQSHSSKTKFLVIMSAQNLKTKASNMSGTVRKDKCLGVHFDKKPSFDIHIEKLCKKVCSGMGALRRIKSFVPLCSLEALYKSLIQPNFDCCSHLWDTSSKLLKDNLQRLQNIVLQVSPLRPEYVIL